MAVLVKNVRQRLPQATIPQTSHVLTEYMRKSLYLIAGWTSLGTGILGILLPLVPTVPFLLLSAFCFSRSSSRHHNWLLSHRWFGTHIRQWEATRTVRRETKIKALILIVISFAITIGVLTPSLIWRIVVVFLAIALFTAVILLPEQRAEKMIKPDHPTP